jgi:hypothetical protein
VFGLQHRLRNSFLRGKRANEHEGVGMVFARRHSREGHDCRMRSVLTLFVVIKKRGMKLGVKKADVLM